MTALEAIAQREARVQYDHARKRHQKALLEGTREPLRHTFAYRYLVRYAPSENLVIREIG
jgi:hypothetical protein